MNIIPRFGKNLKNGLFNMTKKYTTPSATPPNPPTTNPSVTSFNSNIKLPLTNTRKILCVWAKRYPSLKDVPDHVTFKRRIPIQYFFVVISLGFRMICFVSFLYYRGNNVDFLIPNLNDVADMVNFFSTLTCSVDPFFSYLISLAGYYYFHSWDAG